MSNEAPQHMDDIIIPDIEIDKGWPVSDVTTIEDCDDAYAFLMAAIANIEFNIEVETFKPVENQDRHWAARARCALKYKKAAAQIVHNKRSKLFADQKKARQETRDRKLIEFIRRSVDDATFLGWLHKSGYASELTEIDE